MIGRQWVGALARRVIVLRDTSDEKPESAFASGRLPVAAGSSRRSWDGRLAYCAEGMIPASSSPALSGAGDSPARKAPAMTATFEVQRTRQTMLIGFSRTEPLLEVLRRLGPPTGFRCLWISHRGLMSQR